MLVISPLRAVMFDQAKYTRSHGIATGVITKREEMSADEIVQIKQGQVSVIFSSPEAVLLPMWKEALISLPMGSNICAVCLDEAHCISSWLVCTLTIPIISSTIEYGNVLILPSSSWTH